MTLDFEADAGQSYVTDDKLKSIADLAQRQIELEKEQLAAEEHLKIINDRLSKIKNGALPMAMDEAGITEFVTQDGRKITVTDKIKAGIPEAQKYHAFKWMRENGYGMLIKNEVNVKFGMKQDEQARKLLEELSGRGMAVDQKESVHNATLVKFVKEALAEGRNLPLESFNVFQYRESKITTKK